MSTNSSSDPLVAEITDALRGARWPMTKTELVEWANSNRARSQVTDAINQMSYDKFYSIDDVTRDFVND